MSKQRGFTLIELVIVIVILGILSATAIPKFVNLSSDARIASLEGIKGALSSTSSIIQLKAQVEGVDDTVGVNVFFDIDDDGTDDVFMNSGYMSSVWGNAWEPVIDFGEPLTSSSPTSECTGTSLCVFGNAPVSASYFSGLPSDISDDDPNPSTDVIVFWFEGDQVSDDCYAYYYNPETGDAPTIGIVDEGC